MSLVSIIIPCKNMGSTLIEAIDSVLHQTHSSMEIIVVNDGSDDTDTLKVFERLPKRVILLNQSNKGLPAARNVGITASSGEYVLPLDSDDCINPKMIETCLAYLKKDKTLGFVYTDIEFFGNQCGIHKQLPYNFYDELFKNQITVCALLRRCAWKSVKGYNEAMTLGAEDWEFWIALGEAGWHGYHISEPLFKYRVRDGSMSSNLEAQLPKLRNMIRDFHPNLYTEESLQKLEKIWKGYLNVKDPAGIFYRIKRKMKVLYGGL